MRPCNRTLRAFAPACISPIAFACGVHADTVIAGGQTVTRNGAADIGSLLQFGPGGGAGQLQMPGALGLQQFVGGLSFVGGTEASFILGAGSILELSPSSVSGSPPQVAVGGGGQLTLGTGSFGGMAPSLFGLGGGSAIDVADPRWVNGAGTIFMSGDGNRFTYSGTGNAAFGGLLKLNGGVGMTNTIDVAPGAGTLSLTGKIEASSSNLRIHGDGPGGSVVELGFTSGTFARKLVLDSALVEITTQRSIGAAGLESTSSAIQLATSISLDAAQSVTLQNNTKLLNFSGQPTVGFSIAGTITGNAFSSLAAFDGVQMTISGDSSATFQGRVGLNGPSSLTLQDGRLDLATVTTAAPEALLAGTGTIGALQGAPAGGFAGTVAPGRAGSTSAGGLAVLGDANLGSPTAVLSSRLFAGAGNADRLTVGGTATITGSILKLVYDPSISGGALAPQPGTLDQYTVITAGAIAGNFGTAQLVMVDPITGFRTIQNLSVAGSTQAVGTEISMSAVGGQYIVSVLTPAPLGPGTTNTNVPVVVQTPGGNIAVDPGLGTVTNLQINQSVATIQNIVLAPQVTTDAQYVATALLSLPAGVLPGAVVAAGVSANPNALPDVTIDSMTQAGNVAMKRLMQVRDGVLGAAAAKSGGDGPGTVNYGEFGAALQGPTPAEGVRGWMRGFGFYESVDGQSAAQGSYDASMGGALVGGDVALDGGLIAGAFLGYAPGSMTIETLMGQESDTMNGVDFGVYGSWVPDGGSLYVQAVAMGTYTGLDRTRNVWFPAVVRTATSSSDVWGMNLGGEAGLNLRMGEDTWLQPFLGLNYGYVWRSGYNEQGAGSLNLTDSAQSASELQPTAGARFLHSYRTEAGVLSPFLGAAFIAQVPLGDWSTTATNAFDAGNTFTFLEGPNDRYGATFEAGLEWAAINGMTAYASFNGMAADGKQRYGGQIGVQIPF